MVGVSSDVEVVSKKSENMVVLSSSQNPSGRNVPFLPNNRCPANTAISIQGTKANTQKNIQNRTSFVVKRCLAFFRNSTSTKKKAMTKNILRFSLLSTSAFFVGGPNCSLFILIMLKQKIQFESILYSFPLNY